MTEKEAYLEAERRIAQEKIANTGALEIPDLHALTKIPDSISQLAHLKLLDCSFTKVESLEPIRDLTHLKHVNCLGACIDSIEPVKELTQLTYLDCTGSRISSIESVRKLRRLKHLNCSGTNIASIEPVRKLTQLIQLRCSTTSINSIEPLRKLKHLSVFYCNRTQINSIESVKHLTQLTLLDCSYTNIRSITPIQLLPNLVALYCYKCEISSIPNSLLHIPYLCLNSSQLNLPQETMSINHKENCVRRLRAHYQDLAKSNGQRQPDTKLIVIGNGQIGKTQICRRLRGLSPEEEKNSTHGIQVSRIQDFDNLDNLHIWDFGGQDLYHGTHALFLKSRAIIMLVWTPEAETGCHDFAGKQFQNHPMQYWLEYIKANTTPSNPILIVQSQCDTASDDQPQLAIDVKAVLPDHEVTILQCSAYTPRKIDTLRSAIAEANQLMADTPISENRAKVRDTLLTWREEKKHQTLTITKFEELCEDIGGISSSDMLLRYLHDTGTLFYQEGLFDNQIILDQNWALNAIYSLLDRDKSHDFITTQGGKFSLGQLSQSVWQAYSEGEQKLFLSMMKQCGICFYYAGKRFFEDENTLYLAPELLPNKNDKTLLPATANRWQGEPQIRMLWRYPFFHSGIMPQVISRFGESAGAIPTYWRGGMCFSELNSGTDVLMEAVAEPEGYAGTLTVECYGHNVDTTATTIRDTIEQLHRQLAYTDISLDISRPLDDMKDDSTLDIGRIEQRIGVSYAWGPEDDKKHEGNKKVAALCAQLQEKGYRVIRDRDELQTGDSLSEFMRHLAHSDQLYIFLSPAYIRSRNCMYEFLVAWQSHRDDPSAFLEKVKVFTFKDTNIYNEDARDDYVDYWIEQKEKAEKRIERQGAALSPEALARAKATVEIANNVSGFLEIIADRIAPNDFDEYVARAIDALPDMGGKI